MGVTIRIIDADAAEERLLAAPEKLRRGRNPQLWQLYG
jgi:hypothetical protein